MRRVSVPLAVTILGVACGGTAPGGVATPNAAAAARAELAPTGKLRLGFTAAPPFLGHQDPSSGQWKGLAITVGDTLAKSLGVSMVPTQYPDPIQAYQALQSRNVDVVLAQLQLKPDGVSSTGAMLSVPHTYLVRGDSPLHNASDVDKQGIRVGSTAGAGHTGFLASNLQHAKLVQFASDAAGLTALASGQIDALADGRFALTDFTTQLPGSRILDGAFLTPMFAFATLSSRPNAATYLNAFVVSQLANGAVTQDINTIVGKPGVLAGPA